MLLLFLAVFRQVKDVEEAGLKGKGLANIPSSNGMEGCTCEGNAFPFFGLVFAIDAKSCLDHPV
jgi:hypothetical protein